jgi:exonuclease III
MTLNAEGILRSGRELVLANMLMANNVDVMIVTETKIPADLHGDFNVEGYTSYLPHASFLLKRAKYKVVAMVRTALATSMNAKLWLDLMQASVQSV